MPRATLGNVVKVALALVLFPFLAFLVLVIGLCTKKKKVALEGAVYAAVFIVAFSIPQEGALGTLAAFLGLGALIVSAGRAVALRSLWLSASSPRPHLPAASAQAVRTEQLTYQPSPRVTLPSQSSADDLSSALAWVVSYAKQNKHRLPSGSYVTILETCQTLDEVIDAERQQPLSDASFEYELGVMAREYLPGVLRGYLAIPPSMVNDRQPNGRTPNEELTEQLQLLSGQAEALHSNRHSQTSADLTSTGNFLRERFGHLQRGGFDFGIK